MRRVLQMIGWLALLGTVGPALLYLTGHVEHDVVSRVMLVATVLWFVTAPWWMDRKR